MYDRKKSGISIQKTLNWQNFFLQLTSINSLIIFLSNFYQSLCTNYVMFQILIINTLIFETFLSNILSIIIIGPHYNLHYNFSRKLYVFIICTNMYRQIKLCKTTIAKKIWLWAYYKLSLIKYYYHRVLWHYYVLSEIVLIDHK